MKKILNTALIAIVFSAMMVDTLRAKYVSDGGAGAGAAMEETVTTPRRRGRRAPARGRGGRRAPARRGRRGAAQMRMDAKNIKVALDTAKTSNDPKVVAEAKKTANELAQELLIGLEERTWLGDVLGKYTAEQVAAAGAKYTQLEIQKTQLMKDIETKQAELDAMSTKRLIFWTKAEGGKEEAHKIASQELAEMKTTLRNVNKALRDQAVIAGKEYCATIRMAIGALSAASLAGLAYGIDKYTGSKGMGYLSTKYTEMELGRKEGESISEYGQRQFGNAYNAVKGSLNTMTKAVGDKSTALKKWTKDTIGYYWGSKAEAPQNVNNASTTATNSQNTADQRQAAADQNPGNKQLENAADKAQQKADADAAKLETVVAQEAQKQEDQGIAPAGAPAE